MESNDNEIQQAVPSEANRVFFVSVVVLVVSIISIVVGVAFTFSQIALTETEAKQLREQCSMLEAELAQTSKDLQDIYSVALSPNGIDQAAYQQLLNRAIAFHERMIINNRRIEPYRSNLLRSYSQLAGLSELAGDLQKAESALRSLLTVHVQRLCGDQHPSECCVSAANALFHLGDILKRQNRADEARASFEASCRLWEELPSETRRLQEHTSAIVAAYDAYLAVLRVQKDHDKAASVCGRVIKFLENDCHTFPWQKNGLATAYCNQAMELGRAGRLEDAEAVLAEAQLLIDNVTNAPMRQLVNAQAQLLRAAFLDRRGRIQERDQECRKFAKSVADLSNSNLAFLDLSSQLKLAVQLTRLGDLAKNSGRLSDAEPCYRKAMEIYSGVSVSVSTLNVESQLADVTKSLAAVYCAQAALEEATKVLRGSIERIARVQRASRGSITMLVAGQLAALGYVQYKAGKWDAVVTTITASIDAYEPEDAETWLILSIANQHVGDAVAARHAYSRAAEWLKHSDPSDGLQELLVEAATLLGEDIGEPFPPQTAQ